MLSLGFETAQRADLKGQHPADAFQAQTSAFAGSTETAALIVSALEIASVQIT